MFFMCVTASSLSALLVLLGAKLLPAGRIRTILIFLGIFMVILFVLLLRLTRPEQLVNPDTFATVVTYLNSLQMPSSPLLPTTWISDALQAGLKNNPKILFLNMSLTISFSLMVMSINHLLAYQFYFTGFPNLKSRHSVFFILLSTINFHGKIYSIFFLVSPKPLPSRKSEHSLEIRLYGLNCS